MSRTPASGQDVGDTERERGHHIPDVLLDAVGSLPNVHCGDAIHSFAEQYRAKSFKSFREEYAFVSSSMSGLLNQYFHRPFTDALTNCMLFSQAVSGCDDDNREHFIHTFQVYLTGLVIIDHFHDFFCQSYSLDLCRRPDTSVDAAWLLASIFHDWKKGADKLRGIMMYGYNAPQPSLSEQDRLINAVSSMLQHLSGGADAARWNEQIQQNPAISDLIRDCLAKQGHGALGALHLMNEIKNIVGTIGPADVIAGATIFTHDYRPIKDCLRNLGMFPLSCRRFPLSVLLLFCDAAHEWQRQTDYRTWPRLLGIRFGANSVNCTVGFTVSGDKARKDEEFEQVKTYITFTDSPTMTLDAIYIATEMPV